MKFCVYVYCDPTKSSSLLSCGFEPYYIGKGKSTEKRNRAYDHLKDCYGPKATSPNHKKTKSLLDKNIQPYIEILEWFSTSQDALDKEIEYIARFGRRDIGTGILLNLTDGGDGCHGNKFTPEQRKARSESLKRQHSEGKRITASDKLRGVPLTEEHKSKIRATLQGQTFTENRKSNIASATKNAMINSYPYWHITTPTSPIGDFCTKCGEDVVSVLGFNISRVGQTMKRGRAKDYALHRITKSHLEEN